MNNRVQQRFIKNNNNNNNNINTRLKPHHHTIRRGRNDDDYNDDDDHEFNRQQKNSDHESLLREIFGSSSSSYPPTQQHQRHQNNNSNNGRFNSPLQSPLLTATSSPTNSKLSSSSSPTCTSSSSSSLESLVLQLTPTPQECAKRYQAFRDLRDLLKNRLGLHVYVFGSQRTGITLPTSDVDVVARLKPLKVGGMLDPTDSDTATDDEDFEEVSRAAAKKLQQSQQQQQHQIRFPQNGGGNRHQQHQAGIVGGGGGRRKSNAPPEFDQTFRVLRQDKRFFNVVPIAHAKVPIVKMKHRRTGVEMDVCFQDDGLDTSRYLTRQFDECCNVHHEPARALVVLLKAFVAGLGLNDPATHGVGSFVCSMLVLFYLKKRREGNDSQNDNKKDTSKQQHKKNKKSSTTHDKNLQETSSSSSRYTLEEYFTDLLHFYVEEFNSSHYGVDCSTWKPFRKENFSELVLLNPLQPSRNCASAATLFIPKVLPEMRRLYQKIRTGHPPARKDDILPNWILFPKIFIPNQEVLSRMNPGFRNRYFNNQQQQNSSSSWFINDDDGDRYYAKNQTVIGGFYYNNDEGNSRNLVDDKTGKRVPKTLLWKKRWENLAFLKQQVSNVPSCDADGFYCALSM